MAKRKKEGNGGIGDGLVAVTVAPSLSVAEQLRELLEDHDIPVVVATGSAIEDVPDALIEEAVDIGPPLGVPILVPEVMLEEASEIIADREECDEIEDDEVVSDDDGDDMIDAMEVDLEDWDASVAPSPDDDEDHPLLGAELDLDEDDEFDDTD